MQLIVGLGNPGDTYRHTRHNVGFMVIDAMADEYAIAMKPSKFNVICGSGNIKGNTVMLAKPTAFMNLSGPPIRRLTEYYRIPGEEMLVIHDDIDLTFQRLKIKRKGGHGGHNGIRSMVQAFGTGDFARLRIGVGRPEARDGVVNHVLGRFAPEEIRHLGDVITQAQEAVVTIICNGIQEGMNKFNPIGT